MKQGLRRILPQCTLDTYHLVRRTRRVAPVGLSSAKFVMKSLGHYVRQSKLPIQLEIEDAGSVFVRPYSSDLLMISTLIGPDGEYQAVRSMLPGIKTIIDAGTNIGFTLRLWLRWYPEARIASVEPDAENFHIATLNVDPADRHRVTFFNNALSDRPGTLHLNRAAPAWAFHVVEDAQPGTVAVDAVTMPDLIAALGGGPVDLLKCDIEGGEKPLFKACAPWIGRVRNLVVETHAPYTLAELQADLIAAGSSLKLVRQVSDAAEQSVGIFSTPTA